MAREEEKVHRCCLAAPATLSSPTFVKQVGGFSMFHTAYGADRNPAAGA
jgi:hypothetical protein